MSSSARFLLSFMLCLWLVDGSVGFEDCDDMKRLGIKSGVHTVYPYDGKDPINVYCDQEEDGGGWLVIQRRQDGSDNFFRDWESYLNGFGNLSGEFWLGNEKIHRLTSQRSYELRVNIEDFDNHKRHADYKYFSIGPVTDYYRLYVFGYCGNAGDSLKKHNGLQFSAKDLDKDTINVHCSKKYKGGWWFANCLDSSLNGPYKKVKMSRGVGLIWKTFKSSKYSLKMTEMKIRQKKNREMEIVFI